MDHSLRQSGDPIIVRQFPSPTSNLRRVPPHHFLDSDATIPDGFRCSQRKGSQCRMGWSVCLCVG
ncbi:hypothetical protein Hanom_Chr00s000003g01605991 [Helianthus anomalus]